MRNPLGEETRSTKVIWSLSTNGLLHTYGTQIQKNGIKYWSTFNSSPPLASASWHSGTGDIGNNNQQIKRLESSLIPHINQDSIWPHRPMKNKSTSKKNPPNELLQHRMLRVKNTYYWSLQRNKQGLRPHLLSSHNPIIYNTLRISKRWLLGVQLAAMVKHKGSHTSYFFRRMDNGTWFSNFYIQLSQLQPHRHRDHIMTCFIHKDICPDKTLGSIFILPQ